MGWGNGISIGWATVVSNGNSPINVGLPVISGTATIGQTLTSTTGSWSSESPIIEYLYQWYRGTNPIPGAIGSTRVLNAADVSFEITCRVAAVNNSGTSTYASSNQIFLYDASYTAIINRATSLAYGMPTFAQRKKESRLLTDMKDNGIWTKLDVFYNYATSGSQEFATLNWKNPSIFQNVLVASPVFIPNQGFKGTGLSYIESYNTNTGGPYQYTQNNASRYFYLYEAGVSANTALDGVIVSGVSYDTISRSDSLVQRINQGVSNIPTTFDYTATRGMKSIHRTNSTNVELFNDTTQGSRTVTSSSTINNKRLILRNTISSPYATHTVSMYAMGASLVVENTNFVNIYNNYINSL